MADTAALAAAVTDAIVRTARSNCRVSHFAAQNITMRDIQSETCNLQFGDIEQTADLEFDLRCLAHDRDLRAALRRTVPAALAQRTGDARATVDVDALLDCVVATSGLQSVTLEKLRLECGPGGGTVHAGNVAQTVVARGVANCLRGPAAPPPPPDPAPPGWHLYALAGLGLLLVLLLLSLAAALLWKRKG